MFMVFEWIDFLTRTVSASNVREGGGLGHERLSWKRSDADSWDSNNITKYSNSLVVINFTTSL